MIKFIDYASVGGVPYSKGMVARFDTVTELQLIAVGDAEIVKIPELIGQLSAGASRTSVNTAADNAYQTLASVIVPAGMMGLNSSLLIYSDWTYPNSASTKSLAVDFGGTNLQVLTQTTAVSCSIITRILALNSLASQSTFNSINFGLGATNTRKTSTIDTTVDQNIDFKVEWGGAASGETINLIGFSVWHYPGN